MTSVRPAPASGVEAIMVTYHSADNVRLFLAGLGDQLPLAVVDNSQGADDVAALLEGRPATRYQHGPGRGFATAANIGARTSSADYLVFVNPDSRPSAAVITSLVTDLRSNDRLGAVAALMVGPDGVTEHGVGGWQPTPRRALVHALGLHKWFPRAGLYARPRSGEPLEVDWLTGACMAVPRQVFLQLGGFDERYFVYSEDVDFGRRLQEAGYASRLRTDLLVQHSAASSGGAPSTAMGRMRGSSFAAYTRRQLSPAAANAVIALEAAGSLARAVLHRLRSRPGIARVLTAYTRGLVLGAPLPVAGRADQPS